MPRRREGEPIQRASDLWRKIGEPGPGAHCRGYARFSHAAGHYGLTVPGQKKHLQAYADTRGWVIDAFDVEPATSAKYDAIEDRPVFRQHLELCEAGACQVSLVYMNDRWARNGGVAYNSLSRLRKAGIWWATTDDRWNIDRIQEDGWDVAYAVDVAMNAAYSRKVSEKTRIGKQTRAELGFHNGDVHYGYLRPPDPPKPEGAPSDWKPPRQALLPHPENFARLQQIGEWAAAGMSDRQIAARCNDLGWRSQAKPGIGAARHYAGGDSLGGDRMTHEVSGSRLFSKDAVRTILTAAFPRAYAPGSDRGSVIAPDGRRIQGLHPAAWDWDLCEAIDQARGRRSHGGQTDQARAGHVWLFSGLAVCAGCGHRLRAQGMPAHAQRRMYGCVAKARGLSCPNVGWRSMAEDELEAAFVALLRQHPLPADWRELIANDVNHLAEAADTRAMGSRRADLLRERDRVLFQHQHGLIDDRRLLRESERIRQALDNLGTPDDAAGDTAVQIEAGDTLATLPAYWEAATPQERQELVRRLIVPEGLRVDTHHKRIAGLRPRPVYRAALSLALQDWEEDEDGWLVPPQDTPPRRRTLSTAG